MPPSPQRLALAITLLASGGFIEAAAAKTLQIDTPTTQGQTLGGQ